MASCVCTLRACVTCVYICPHGLIALSLEDKGGLHDSEIADEVVGRSPHLEHVGKLLLLLLLEKGGITQNPLQDERG